MTFLAFSPRRYHIIFLTRFAQKNKVDDMLSRQFSVDDKLSRQFSVYDKLSRQFGVDDTLSRLTCGNELDEITLV